MSAANFRMRLFAPAQNGAQWRIFLEVFFWIFPKIIIISRFSPRRFTSQGTTTPQVRGQPIAMCDFFSTFALAFVGDGFANESLFPGQRLQRSASSPLPIRAELSGGPKKDASHYHRTFIALPSHTRTRVAAMSPAGVLGPEGMLSRKKEIPPLRGGINYRTEII